MKNKIKSLIHKKVESCYFEIEENNSGLIFHLKNNSIRFSKKQLIIKHRDSGKRLALTIKHSKAILTKDTLREIGELGLYDIYVQYYINKSYILKRANFIEENQNKTLIDKENKRVFSPFKTHYYNLSFKYEECKFIARALNFKKQDDELILNGEIRLLEDIKFNSVELSIKLNNSREYIPCDYKIVPEDGKNKIIKFKVKIPKLSFNELDLNNSFYIAIQLKNDAAIIVGKGSIKYINTINTYEDKFLETIDNCEISIEDENNKNINWSMSFFVNNSSNITFRLINQKDKNKLIENEKRLDIYYKNTKNSSKKMVFFESFNGKSYSGQPKYIYEKMLELGLNEYYEFIWSYDGDLKIPGNPIITNRDYNSYKELLLKSNYWISNISFPILKRNKNTIYIQTTHGTPYKQRGSDIQGKNKKIAKGRVLLESPTWDYLLSANDFSKKVFKRAFEYKGAIINKGYPANDIFYQSSKNIELKKQEIIKNLDIKTEKKVILYAPTFRDYHKETNKRSFDLLLDLKRLKEELSDEYMIILRLHYLLSDNLDLSEVEDFAIDLSNYDDINDLYLISDLLITDYSSAFFDFGHSKKPILFYVPDFEEYSSFRGLYSEIKNNLPGPEIYTNEELIENIKNINKVNQEFKNKYNTFYNTYCNLGHGTASEDVIKTVFKEVNG